MTDRPTWKQAGPGRPVGITNAALFERHHDPDTGWRQHAACRGVDPDLFFPEQGGDTSNAKKVCATCPVIGPCGDFGMHEKYGIFGGLSERQRRRMRRQRRIPEPVDDLDARLTVLRDQLERIRLAALAVEILRVETEAV